MMAAQRRYEELKAMWARASPAERRQIEREADRVFRELLKAKADYEGLQYLAMTLQAAPAAGAVKLRKPRKGMSLKQHLGYLEQLLKRLGKGAQQAGSRVWDVVKAGAQWVPAGVSAWALIKFGGMELQQSEALTKFGQTELEIEKMKQAGMEEYRKIKLRELALKEQELALKWTQLAQQHGRLNQYRERRNQKYSAAKRVDPHVKAALEMQVAEAKARSAAMWQDWERAREAAREASLETLKANLKAAIEQGKIIGQDWLDAREKARQAALEEWKAQLKAYLQNLETAGELAKIMRKAEAEMKVAITKEMARMRREMAVERLKGLIEMDLEREKTLRNLQETARTLNVQQKRLVGDLLATVKELIKAGKDYREPLRLAIDILANPEKYAERLHAREVRIRRW